ncbi:MAG: diacylglycerol kinase family protein [Phycisphaerales bacterium]|jgi:diacylglycerol kinase (ATP)|nr:diacylglycerol kinase family protein [Phycisphaerales bacterium]
MRVIVLYNPVSGRGRACKFAGAISESFLKVPCDVEMIPTQNENPNKWLLPKLQIHPDAVVVVGGDGTLRQAASVLVNTNIPVYHAASGTENLFAKSMNTNGNTPEDVVQSIINPNMIEIDTAIANGKFMLLMASVGFDASVVTDLSNNRGRSITHFSYVLPCIKQFLKWNPPVITISVDGEQIVDNMIGWAVVANSKQYARGLNPARNANITDGKLDVVFLPLKGRLNLLNWIRWMKRGTHLHHPDAIYSTGKRITVKTDGKSLWQIDGDAIGCATEMKLECVSNSLRVFK